MYKHILLPTDGSRVSAKGIREGVRLAKRLGARVTGVYVAPPFVPPIYSEGAAFYSGSFSSREYRKLVQKIAKRYLAVIERAARKARVRCRTLLATDHLPWQGILRTARARKCDLIVMASHGRSAMGGLILGSETTQVLARSKIPVLVVR
jgi:nucleotide-binding universal stress UspA family protein